MVWYLGIIAGDTLKYLAVSLFLSFLTGLFGLFYFFPLLFPYLSYLSSIFILATYVMVVLDV